MPVLTSDDPVLTYRPRWLGVPGAFSFRLGVYYEQLWGFYAGWVVEAIALAVLTLTAGAGTALIVALLAHVALCLAALAPGKRAVGILAGAFIAIAAMQVPILAVLLTPWVHAVLVGKAVGRIVDSDRSVGQWLTVLRAEAAAPRHVEPVTTTYVSGPAPTITDKAPRL